MKKFKSTIINILFIGLIFSCGGSDDIIPQTAQEVFVIDISRSWNISNNGTITQDGVDITSQFPNFVVTFANKTYSSSGGFNLWLDGSGTWDFANSETTTEIVVDGVPMDVTLNSGSLTLSWSNAAIGARISGVTDNFIINVSQ